MTAIRGRGDLRASAVDVVCNDSRVARLRNSRLPGADRSAAILIGGGLIALLAGLAIIRLFLWSDGVPAPAEVTLSDVFDTEALAADRDFRRPIRALAVAAAFIPLIAGIALIAFSRRIASLLDRASALPTAAAGVVIGAGLAAAIGVVRLPVGALINERLRDGGVVRRGTGSWALDALQGIGVQVVVFAVAIGGLSLAVRYLPRAWPAAVAGGLIAIAVAVAFVSPLVIQPLFENTRPVEDAALAAEIRELADLAGVDVSEVVVNDAASRSRTFNARVEGIGATRRVVLFDTLIDEGDREQLRWTVAHELAHEKHRHIAKGLTGYTLMMIPLTLLAAGMVALLTGSGPGRPDRLTALRRTAIAAGAIVVLITVSAPIQNGVSRAYEAEADWTALQITDEPLAAIRARAASRSRARSDPDPPRALHLWFGSHPTHRERVGLALRDLETS